MHRLRSSLRTACGALALCWGLAASAPVLAQEGEAGTVTQPADDELRPLLVGLRGVAEVFQDRFIVGHYRSSRFTGAFMTHVPVGQWLGVEAELGYARLPSESTRPLVSPGQLEYVPISLSLVAVKEARLAELFGGIGYGMAVFTERTDAGTVTGAKPGIDFRAGTRIHTRLMKQTLRPEGVTGPQGLDVELLIGRRQHHAFGVGSGFDFSTWRLGVGMVVRL